MNLPTPKLIPSAWLLDWFVLEPYAGSAQPEGTIDQWRIILEAMKHRQGKTFLRIAVYFDAPGHAWFYSPRHSMDEAAACVPAGEVDAWIRRAQAILSAYNVSLKDLV